MKIVAAILVVAAAFHLVEGWISGWSRLARTYPSSGGKASRLLPFVSGELGWMWRGFLTLAACDHGLRLSTWLRRPILVPWHDVHVEQVGGLMRPMTQLVFGQPEIGRLRIASTVWDDLQNARSTS